MSKSNRKSGRLDKQGNNGFYGRKQEAKEYSNKNRRQLDRMIAHGNFNDGDFDDFND